MSPHTGYYEWKRSKIMPLKVIGNENWLRKMTWESDGENILASFKQ